MVADTPTSAADTAVAGAATAAADMPAAASAVAADTVAAAAMAVVDTGNLNNCTLKGPSASAGGPFLCIEIPGNSLNSAHTLQADVMRAAVFSGLTPTSL
jgi:hypothetical protein